MSVLDEPTPPEASRVGRKLLLLAGVIVGLVAVWFTYGWHLEEAPAPTALTAPAPARPRTPAPSSTTAPDLPAASAVPSTADRPAAPAAPTANKATPTGVLRVHSDIAGASVFLDRKYLGTTPLDVDGLSPGSHRLNVSADGYEGHAQAIDIGDAPAEVEVRFKDVRLDAAVAVVHKHGVGSCTGRLVADATGLRYETASAGDAFTMRFDDLETFTVDYLKKNLRVKKRGGRTWNFDDPKGQADNLFVFHREVEKARTRLAAR